jgi:hypothetical protein
MGYRHWGSTRLLRLHLHARPFRHDRASGLRWHGFPRCGSSRRNQWLKLSVTQYALGFDEGALFEGAGPFSELPQTIRCHSVRVFVFAGVLVLPTHVGCEGKLPQRAGPGFEVPNPPQKGIIRNSMARCSSGLRFEQWKQPCACRVCRVRRVRRLTVSQCGSPIPEVDSRCAESADLRRHHTSRDMRLLPLSAHC